MATSYDDMLNGGAAAPAYAQPVPEALPTAPKDGVVDLSVKGVAGMASSRTILLVWFLVVAFLVASHVLTLSVQR